MDTETADVIGHDVTTITCVCGNTVSKDGLIQANSQGVPVYIGQHPGPHRAGGMARCRGHPGPLESQRPGMNLVSGRILSGQPAPWPSRATSSRTLAVGDSDTSCPMTSGLSHT